MAKVGEENIEDHFNRIRKKIELRKFKPVLHEAGTIDKSKFSIFGEVLTDKKKKIGQVPEEQADPEANLQHLAVSKKLKEADVSVKLITRRRSSINIPADVQKVLLKSIEPKVTDPKSANKVSTQDRRQLLKTVNHLKPSLDVPQARQSYRTNIPKSLNNQDPLTANELRHKIVSDEMDPDSETDLPLKEVSSAEEYSLSEDKKTEEIIEKRSLRDLRRKYQKKEAKLFSLEDIDEDTSRKFGRKQKIHSVEAAQKRALFRQRGFEDWKAATFEDIIRSVNDVTEYHSENETGKSELRRRFSIDDRNWLIPIHFLEEKTAESASDDDDEDVQLVLLESAKWDYGKDDDVFVEIPCIGCKQLEEILGDGEYIDNALLEQLLFDPSNKHFESVSKGLSDELKHPEINTNKNSSRRRSSRKSRSRRKRRDSKERASMSETDNEPRKRRRSRSSESSHKFSIDYEKSFDLENDVFDTNENISSTNHYDYLDSPVNTELDNINKQQPVAAELSCVNTLNDDDGDDDDAEISSMSSASDVTVLSAAGLQYRNFKNTTKSSSNKHAQNNFTTADVENESLHGSDRIEIPSNKTLRIVRKIRRDDMLLDRALSLLVEEKTRFNSTNSYNHSREMFSDDDKCLKSPREESSEHWHSGADKQTEVEMNDQEIHPSDGLENIDMMNRGRSFDRFFTQREDNVTEKEKAINASERDYENAKAFDANGKQSVSHDGKARWSLLAAGRHFYSSNKFLTDNDDEELQSQFTLRQGWVLIVKGVVKKSTSENDWVRRVKGWHVFNSTIKEKQSTVDEGFVDSNC